MNCQKELENCNFVKAALMILVVLYHSILFWSESWFTADPVLHSSFLKWLTEYLSSFHIYTFTLISGYIFYYLKYEALKYNSFSEFLKSKFKRLIVPYFFITIIWLIPVHIIFWGFDGKDIFIKYFLGTSPEQLWFLLMLFFVFFISFPLSYLWKSSEITGLVLVLIMYGIGFLGNLFLSNVFMIFTALQYVLYFWIGFKIRQYSDIENKFTVFTRKIHWIWYIVLHLLVLLLYNVFVTTDVKLFKIASVFCKPVLHIIGSVMAFVCLQRIANVKSIAKSLDFFKKRSMTIYMFHQQVIYFSISWFNGILNPYIHGALNFVLSLLVSIVITEILMRFKYTRFLIGEK